MGRSVVCSTLLVALVAGLGCSPPPVALIQYDRQEWVSPAGIKGFRFLTEHYDLRTTSRDEILRDALPEFMEATYSEYARLIPPEGQTRRNDGVATAERMVTYVFGNRQEWAAFTRSFVPAHAEIYMHILSGGYMDQATATSVFWDVKRDHTLALLGHEGLHQYLACHRTRAVPAWLNEGLATQFEDFDMIGLRPLFRPERNLMRKNSLREVLSVENGLTPLPRLLSMHAGEAVLRTGQPARGYYAQIWATVLFLRSSPAYRDAFSRLLADVGSERFALKVSAYRAATPAAANMSDGEASFCHYITEDLDAFMDQFVTFARKLVY